MKGESLEDARKRLRLLWHPRWLLDAGFSAADGNGVVLRDVDDKCTKGGEIGWSPDVILPRVDDKAPADPKEILQKARNKGEKAVSAFLDRENRVLAGEIAVASLWMSDAGAAGISTTDIDIDLSIQSQSGGGARGARWNAALGYYLELALPSWRIETQVNIRDIFGLHLRSDVVSRDADVVVISPSGKVMVLVSAKFSWRSDRGTEAAQMVFLQRYRPDLPYVLITAEFPRALTEITTGSIEDQSFHLCGEWVGAWAATQQISDPDEIFPDLMSLKEAGRLAVPAGTLLGLDSLSKKLEAAARYI